MANLKYYIRSLVKQKFTSIISIIGISIGFASCIIIGLYVKTEFSFDKFHQNRDNIYRLLSTSETGQNSASVTYRLGPDCAQNISGVTDFARLYNFWGPNEINCDNENYKAENLFFTDPGILNIFSFAFLEGNKNEAFHNPGSIILTKEMADKYFGNSPALGKTVTLDNDEMLTVTGVVEAFPYNSHFQFDHLVYDPRRIESFGDWINSSWSFSNFKTYLLFQENFSKDQFYTEFENFTQKTVDNESKSYIQNTQIQNLSNVHLYSKNIEDDFSSKGNYESIIVLITLAFCILLIGTINYVSLYTSNAYKRTRETSIRKISGAGKYNIALNYVAESFILVFLSMLLALLIVKTIHLKLGNYIGLQLSIQDIMNPIFIGVSITLALLISLLTGIYVSGNMLKYNPVELLRGRQKHSKITGYSKSYIFLSVQFAISIILIISTGFIFKQMNLIQTKNLGYESDMVLSIPISKTQNTRNVLKEALLKNPHIKEITFTSSFPPNDYHNGNVNEIDGLEQKAVSAKNFFVDFNFIDFMQIEIAEGRNFLNGSQLDEKESAMVNQAFVNKMGWDSAIGKRIKNQYNQEELKIVGVVKDFHFKSLHELIEPVLITVSTQSDLYNMGVKFNGDITTSDIEYIKSEWAKINPGHLFEYQFLDSIVNQNYTKDKQQAHTILLFSLLAVVITCLGLVAISIFHAKQLTKEIGIRKVNGAKVSEILAMLNKDFIKWVVIAFIIAAPVSYLLMQKWLENFAYKTSMSWWVFALAGVLALGIALLTVSWQSWRAATRNPVEALRYE